MRSLTAKIMLIAGLCFCFMLGLFFIKGIVSERQRYAQQAIDEIAHDNVYPQTVMSPFIVVPVRYELCTASRATDKAAKDCTVTHYRTIYAANSQWDNRIKAAQNFRKGIYRATNYDNQITIQGRFNPDPELLKAVAGQTVLWDQARLYLALTDLRGLTQVPVITLDDKNYRFNLESQQDLGNGFPLAYSSLALGERAKNNLDFKLSLTLSGLQSFRMIPLGKSIRSSLSSNWIHPNFSGGISPQTKTISAKSTLAQWNSSYAPTINSGLLSRCLHSGAISDCEKLQAGTSRRGDGDSYGTAETARSELAPTQVQSFNLQFFQPINVYSLTDRTLKYALLFIVIIFGTFFLFEILKNLQVHPIQYALVGAAQGVFYLLLLSFSEQFSFGLAYLGSSAACVLLISWYVSYVLQGIRRALSLTVIMSGIYGTLYILLRSQQHTLMLGSVLIFLLIAVVMILTRHINWYQVGSRKVQP